ncbi:MAG TPA: hypothetical protein VF521_01990, partial [Pyrinomonadaceae bacterium]
MRTEGGRRTAVGGEQVGGGCPHPSKGGRSLNKNILKLTVLDCLLPTAVCVLVSALCLVQPARRARAHDGEKEPPLLEVGGEVKGATPEAPAELRVVSYNIRYRAGEDLKRLVKLLKEDPVIGGAQVIGLQEVDRNKRRTGNVNTAR